jgi:peptidoglycan/LPS O-acetylase OafA/YrhL
LIQTHSLITPKLPLGDFFPSKYEDGFSIFWSLSVEEIFYLIWAPLVLRCSTRTLVAIGLVAVFFCPVLRVILHHSQWEFFFFPCRFDTLMVGSLLAILFVACNKGSIQRSALVRSLWAVGLLSIGCLFPLAVHEGLLRHIELRSALSFAAVGYSLLALLFGAMVGLCVFYSGSSLWWCRGLRFKPLVYLGTISYMMYLIHIPVWVTSYKVAMRLYGASFVPNIALGLVATAGTIAFASLSWHYFERPILAYKDSRAAVPQAALEEEDKVLHPVGQRVFSNPERQF